MDVLISGVIASLIATVIGWLATWLYQKNQNAKMFRKMDGHYNEFIMGTEDYRFTSSSEPTASIRIKYLRQNQLSIVVEEVFTSTLLWKGEISMQSKNSGTVAWYYPKMPNKNGHSFGTKSLIYPESAPNMIYLTNDSMGNPSAVLKSITFEELCEQRKDAKVNEKTLPEAQ